jgi:5-methylcytosine-specific restriction enzyme A
MNKMQLREIMKSAGVSEDLIESALDTKAMSKEQIKRRNALYMREWNARPENSVKNRNKVKRWRETNSRRHEGRKQRSAEWREAIITFIGERDGWSCKVCERLLEFRTVELDHIIPVASGGKNLLNNYQFTCSTCNREKSKGLNRKYSI